MAFKISVKFQEVFTFDELSKEAQDKAINDEIIFMADTQEYNKECPGNFEKAVDRAEEMQTLWLLPEYIYEYCLEEIILTIKTNDYKFDKDGNLI